MYNYLGIDTSNYTTSVALYDKRQNVSIQNKMLLPVKDGSIGLRQSDAVFYHVQRLPEIVCNLLNGAEFTISAVGVSSRPRDDSKSYMPCFTVGQSSAKIISSILGIPYYEFSHQSGHIVSALFGANKLNLLNEKFIAFHVSGGTTEAVLVVPDKDKIIRTKIIGRSLDLKAGQLIDRVGVSLGFNFPAGPELEKLALTCDENLKVNPCLKDFDCCLSGAENICQRMIRENQEVSVVALFAIKFIEKTIEAMCERFVEKFGDLPFVFSGGVMSNILIRKSLEKKFGGIFAPKELSADNAVGTAILASEVHSR